MKKDLKSRFDEIIFTINLTPDEPTDDDYENGLLLPNLTRDLHEPELFTAILCQTFKSSEGDDDEEFAQKMCALLVNSAMHNTIENERASVDDVYALALAANIAWAMGAGEFLFRIMGYIGASCGKYGIDIPEMATVILKNNDNAHKWGKLDPYRLLEKDYNPMEIIKTTHEGELNPEEIEHIHNILRKMREDME